MGKIWVEDLLSKNIHYKENSGSERAVNSNVLFSEKEAGRFLVHILMLSLNRKGR